MIPGEIPPCESGCDPLDELLSRSVQRRTALAQPPRRVWERIEQQVTAGPAPTSHHPPAERLSQLLAPFVQGLAAAVVCILIGASLMLPRESELRQVERKSSEVAPAAGEHSSLRTPIDSAQRLGRLAAEDEAIELDLGHSAAQKHRSHGERTVSASLMSGDIDLDLAYGGRFGSE